MNQSGFCTILIWIKHEILTFRRTFSFVQVEDYWYDTLCWLTSGTANQLLIFLNNKTGKLNSVLNQSKMFQSKLAFVFWRISLDYPAEARKISHTCIYRICHYFFFFNRGTDSQCSRLKGSQQGMLVICLSIKPGLFHPSLSLHFKNMKEHRPFTEARPWICHSLQRKSDVSVVSWEEIRWKKPGWCSRRAKTRLLFSSNKLKKSPSHSLVLLLFLSLSLLHKKCDSETSSSVTPFYSAAPQEN